MLMIHLIYSYRWWQCTSCKLYGIIQLDINKSPIIESWCRTNYHMVRNINFQIMKVVYFQIIKSDYLILVHQFELRDVIFIIFSYWRVQRAGLSEQYRRDLLVRSLITGLIAMAYLPANEVVDDVDHFIRSEPSCSISRWICGVYMKRVK
jgi:hypothetical protein